MEDVNFIEAVYERDIDLILLEEFHTSPAFRTWFAERAGLTDAASLDFVGAWHSFSHPSLGESDLVLIQARSDGTKAAILIENKITAGPQPEQALRYRQRGEAGVEDGRWDRYRTCIVAPERYLRGTAEAELYDVGISYESIRDWYAKEESDNRSQYRSRLLESAIDHNRRGYSPVPSEEVTRFRRSYAVLALEEFPELGVRGPDAVYGPQADWIQFFPGDLPTGFRLMHKAHEGRVDLELAGCGEKVDQIKVLNAAALDDDMDVIRASKSAAISIAVPEVDRFSDLDEQIASVRKALVAAVRLWKAAGRVRWPE